MKITVCIPTYRGGARLDRALGSILVARAEPVWPPLSPGSPGGVSVLVYDDGSPAQDLVEIRAVTDAPFVHLIRGDVNRGPVAAYRNLVAAVGGDVVLMLDDDATLPPGFFAVLRQLMAVDGIGVLSWRSLGDKPGQSRTPIRGFLEPATQLAGYCMAFRKAVYDEIGGFDERFHTYCSDSDLALRATQAGYPSYRVWWPLIPHEEHGVWRDCPELPNRQKLAERDLAAFKDKWGADGVEMERRALAGLAAKAGV